MEGFERIDRLPLATAVGPVERAASHMLALGECLSHHDSPDKQDVNADDVQVNSFLEQRRQHRLAPSPARSPMTHLAQVSCPSCHRLVPLPLLNAHTATCQVVISPIQTKRFQKNALRASTGGRVSSMRTAGGNTDNSRGGSAWRTRQGTCICVYFLIYCNMSICCGDIRRFISGWGG